MTVRGEKVVVAMSGGVDSSLAVAILKEQGYEVIGITFKLLPQHAEASIRRDNHREQDASELSKEVADVLGIRHITLDLSKTFSRKVIDDFCHQYSRGKTPNPCINCNRNIKFGELMNKAKEMGASFLATGHYARIDASASKRRLLKAKDESRDQTYFLYFLTSGQLDNILFPLGDLTKTEVRGMAAELGLPSANRRESQDICFIPDDYRTFIDKHIHNKPGDVVDTNGVKLGKHNGLAYFTIGQRQRLGLASAKRLYVTKLEAATNRVVVGSDEDLLNAGLRTTQLSWVSGNIPAGEGITARIRHGSSEVVVEQIEVKDDSALVLFEQPQRAAAPGQAIAFYRGEEVLGGGVIDSSLPVESN